MATQDKTKHSVIMVCCFVSFCRLRRGAGRAAFNDAPFYGAADYLGSSKGRRSCGGRSKRRLAGDEKGAASTSFMKRHAHRGRQRLRQLDDKQSVIGIHRFLFVLLLVCFL